MCSRKGEHLAPELRKCPFGAHRMCHAHCAFVGHSGPDSCKMERDDWQIGRIDCVFNCMGPEIASSMLNSHGTLVCTIRACWIVVESSYPLNHNEFVRSSFSQQSQLGMCVSCLPASSNKHSHTHTVGCISANGCLCVCALIQLPIAKSANVPASSIFGRPIASQAALNKSLGHHNLSACV